MCKASNIVLGLDVGGTGIKGGLVDVVTGELVSQRFKVATPQPATPKSISKTISTIISMSDYKGKIIGCGFPAVINNGIAKTASNIDKSWIGVSAKDTFKKFNPKFNFNVINDADVAGYAEMKYGAGKHVKGVVLLITIGTGLGSALFIDGKLVPNTEFGHIYLKEHKKIAEKYASNAVRTKNELSWDKWGNRFKEYLDHIIFLLSPELVILGGGVSKRFDDFRDYLKVDAKVLPAILKNNAGIIGAASFAHNNQNVKANF